MARQRESEMSAECRLCGERTERDESALVGEHLVCAECVARIGVQARPALRKKLERAAGRLSGSVLLAAAFDRATEGVAT